MIDRSQQTKRTLNSKGTLIVKCIGKSITFFTSKPATTGTKKILNPFKKQVA